MTVHLDLSELVREPRRTGIQRVERELIRHWPGPARLQPCCYDAAAGTLRTLPRAVLDVLCEDAPPGGIAAERARLAPHLTPGPPVPDSMPVLNAELFTDPARAGFYFQRAKGGADVSWLVYDFLPWLEPQWFNPDTARWLMPYLRAMRAVPRLSFISGKSRADYVARIARRPGEQAPEAGPVLFLGGDGLGLERQAFAPSRRDFVMLGSLEPRKHSASVMRAFQGLWAQGSGATLTLIGHAAPDMRGERTLLGELAGERRFRHLQNLPDAGVRDVLRGARALLFPSEGEGFGLPAMEALHAGLPVVVSAGLPCLADLPVLGQIRLGAVDAPAIARAVQALSDDAAAARLWADAALLDVPTWRSFAEATAAWMERSATG